MVMSLKELESQLLALTPAEKARIIQILAESLANSGLGIEKKTGRLWG